jgi:hypothetical protein
MEGAQPGLIAEDPRTHIVTLDDAGALVALCGLGSIIRRLPGRFQSGDPLNCRDCESRQAGPA